MVDITMKDAPEELTCPDLHLNLCSNLLAVSLLR